MNFMASHSFLEIGIQSPSPNRPIGGIAGNDVKAIKARIRSSPQFSGGRQLSEIRTEDVNPFRQAALLHVELSQLRQLLLQFDADGQMKGLPGPKEQGNYPDPGA